MTNTDTTLDQLARSVNGLRDDLERLVRIQVECTNDPRDLRWLEAEGIDLDDDESLYTHLWERPLEIVHHATRSSDTYEWVLTHTVIVFCTGGPHIEVHTGTGDIVGHWGNEHVRRSIDQSVCDFYEASLHD